MSKKRGKKKVKDIDKTKLSDGNLLIPQSNSLSLPDKKERKDEYFLGFKRKNFNELWNWNTLENVNF